MDPLPHPAPSTGPSTGPTEAPPPPPPGRGWRDRLPEIAAAIGSALVLAAITGFVTSSWEELDRLERAVTLAAIAVGLTVGGVYVERGSRRLLDRITSLVYLSASAAVAAAVTLAGDAAAPGSGRLTIAAGGLAAAVHAGWVLLRDPSSPTRTSTLALALLYGVGPVGSTLAARFSTMDPADLAVPLLGALDPTVADDAFLLPGLGWALVGTALLALATRLAGRARRAGMVLGTGALFGAALMLNVLSDPVGAFAALCIVLAYLVYGTLTDQPGVQAVGAIGVLLAGIRVLWGLFSGQLVLTVAVLGVGLALLIYALRAARSRAEREQA